MKALKAGQLVTVDGVYRVLWDSWREPTHDEDVMLEICDLKDGDVCVVIEDGFDACGHTGTKILCSNGAVGWTYRTALKSQ